MIGISRFPPDYFKGHSMMELAPFGYMLKMGAEEYDKLFKEKILSKINQVDIVKKITDIALYYGKEKVALCCFEKNQIDCHRHNVAMWLKEKGYEIEEFVAESQDTQTSLF